MTLPTFDSYELPAPDELPPARVGWRLQSRRAALLVHDMQAYFLAPFGGAAPLPAVQANVARLLAAARAAAVPVLFTAQPGSQAPTDRALLTDFWGPGLRADPAQTAIAPAVAPRDGEPVLTKHRYSAFVRTDLADRLRAAGRDQLVVCGVYAHIGCLVTAADAFMLDVQPFLVADAVGDFSRADHDDALSWTARRCGRVLVTADACAALA